MPPAPTPFAGRAATAHSLRHIAELIDHAFADLAPGEPAHIVRVGHDPDDHGRVTLAVLPLLDGEHPADLLRLWTAPPSWTAVGVVSTARSHEVREAAAGPKRPVRLTMLLDRRGRAQCLLTPVGRASAAEHVLAEPPVGPLPDVLARVMRAPTPPPTDGPAAWLEAAWLDQVFARAAADPGRSWTWRGLVQLHPLVDPGEAPTPAAVRARVERAGAPGGWERLRVQLASGSRPAPPPCTAELAAWFDEGSFARFALHAAVPVDLVVDDLGALVAGPLAASIRQALGSLQAARRRRRPRQPTGGGAGAPGIAGEGPLRCERTPQTPMEAQ
ncbi:MAG: hypothetical protein JWM05_3492 [Acidimicrobiales bacterium]|nr:hypothetical protein [Acidimicrobiales bacterium]